MGSAYSIYTQYFPPKPSFTEETVPSQAGRVFIVTGGNNGVGLELMKILYGTGARVYLAARSQVCLTFRGRHTPSLIFRHPLGARRSCDQADHFGPATSGDAGHHSVSPPGSE
jgi:hypothetical protein